MIVTSHCQDFKDFVDAENLMPLPTNDFRNPVCLEMRTLRSGMVDIFASFGEVDLDGKVVPAIANNGAEMGSMDSSDTFASCRTHPYHSQVNMTILATA